MKILFVCFLLIQSALASKEDFEKNLEEGRKIFKEMRAHMNHPCGDYGLEGAHPDFQKNGEIIVDSWQSMNRCDSIDDKVERLRCKLEDSLVRQLVSMGLAMKDIKRIHNECRIKTSNNDPRREGKPIPQVEFSEESILIQKR